MPERRDVGPVPAKKVSATNIRYKFVELSVVTDETLEDAVNEWVARGWILDGIRFAMSDSSRRPTMAFISFVRQNAEPDSERDAGATGPGSPA